MDKRLISPCPILDGVTVMSGPDEEDASTGDRKKNDTIAKNKKSPFSIDGNSVSLLRPLYPAVNGTPGKEDVDLITGFYLGGVLDDIHIR